MSIVERRKTSRARFQFDVPIRFEIAPSESGSAPADARLLNLSESGAALEVAGGYSIGAMLNVSFRLPGPNSQINCWASVRQVLPGRGVTIEFQDLLPFARERIRTFVNSQPTRIRWGTAWRGHSSRTHKTPVRRSKGRVFRPGLWRVAAETISVWIALGGRRLLATGQMMCPTQWPAKMTPIHGSRDAPPASRAA